MNAPEPNPRQERIEQATSRRLAKLRTAPVDTSQLLKAIEKSIPRPQAQPSRLVIGWLKPMRAVAASLLVFGLVAALIISLSGGPVLASADRLARFHDELLSHGGAHLTTVDSVSAANAALASKYPGLPAVPGLPSDHVMSCCTHDLGNKRLACVAMTIDGVPVSMSVAGAADVKMPDCPVVTIEGAPYHVQSHDGINMVMTERDGRWVCLMGRVPADRLAQLAKSLQF